MLYPFKTSVCGAVLALLVSCGQHASPPQPPGQKGDMATMTTSRAPESTETAYLAGGCFWGVEYHLEQIPGVIDVTSGYMGGHTEHPTYREVCSGTTGHLETVEVRFDPTRTNYEAILRTFFEIHDPTQANGQGPDIGEQYQSAVFYTSTEQRRTAEKLIGILKAKGYRVVTVVRPAERFWPAEDYHQDYYRRTGKQPYCHTRIPRFDRKSGG